MSYDELDTKGRPPLLIRILKRVVWTALFVVALILWMTLLHLRL